MAVATAEAASDRELVTAARAGDRQAFAGLYDRYFEPVYSFVVRMTRDRDEAADIAQDTFLKAMNALAGLRQGASFKSWIFAIARNTALNRLERSSRTRPLTFEDDAGEKLGLNLVDGDRFGRPEEAAEARAMASLVWAAAAGLDPKQLSLLQLHLHHGLESAEIAAVTGVTKNNGSVVLSRLKKAVEEAIEAHILLHDGRRYCEALDLALGDAGIRELTPDVRRTVQKHVAACAECGERKRKMVRPLAVFGAFLPVPAPATLKAEVLGQLMSQWPGPSGGGPAGPVRLLPGPAGRGLLPARVLNAAIGLGAFAAVLLAVILFTPLNLARTGDDSDDDPLPIVIDHQTPTPTPSDPATSPGPTEPLTPGALPTPTPTPGAGQTATPATPRGGGGGSELSTPTGTAAPTSTGTQTSTPTGTPTRTPTPTATACIAQLEDNVNGRLNMGTESAGSFVVFNRAPCGGVSVVVTSSETWLSAAPSEFEIGPTGQTGSRTIVVSVNRAALPPGVQLGTVTVAPASGPAVRVVVSAAGPTPTPTATPTSTPTPTATATPDLGAPELALVTCAVAGDPSTVTVRASASDASSVDDVFLTWAGGPTVRMSLESGSATDGVWSGTATLSSPPPDELHLIALDSNGNRTDAFFGFTSQCL